MKKRVLSLFVLLGVLFTLSLFVFAGTPSSPPSTGTYGSFVWYKDNIYSQYHCFATTQSAIVAYLNTPDGGGSGNDALTNIRYGSSGYGSGERQIMPYKTWTWNSGTNTWGDGSEGSGSTIYQQLYRIYSNAPTWLGISNGSAVITLDGTVIYGSLSTPTPTPTPTPILRVDYIVNKSNEVVSPVSANGIDTYAYNGGMSAFHVTDCFVTGSGSWVLEQIKDGYWYDPDIADGEITYSTDFLVPCNVGVFGIGDYYITFYDSDDDEILRYDFKAIADRSVTIQGLIEGGRYSVPPTFDMSSIGSDEIAVVVNDVEIQRFQYPDSHWKTWNKVFLQRSQVVEGANILRVYGDSFPLATMKFYVDVEDGASIPHNDGKIRDTTTTSAVGGGLDGIAGVIDGLGTASGFVTPLKTFLSSVFDFLPPAVIALILLGLTFTIILRFLGR